MARKIRFQKIFNTEEESSICFCGPSNKDGTYAFNVNCPNCLEDITVVLNNKDLYELWLQINRAIIIIDDKKGKNINEI